MRPCLVFGLLLLFVYGCVAPPVTEEKKKTKHDKEGAENNEIEDQAFDVEYKRYLQEVVNILEKDDDFKSRLEKADPDDIKSGKISKDIEFVNHNVRSKLDELKRQELERLRQAAMRQYEHDNGIDRKHMKIPAHVDPNNPHTFEAEDLRKLIVQTTKDLEDADRRRKDEFKEYEMRKELEYQEQLKKMDEKNRSEAQKKHDEMMEKHKKHKPLHHPGSKQQFEQVWEEQDHLSPENFNPKTFFHLHDLDGNGYWDANEVKALFRKELDKMYDPNAPEDDMRERMEEMERMREHVFNETDQNKDQLISFQEFLDQTKRQEFERDEGWEPLDQHQQYTPEEYQQYAGAHEEEIRRMIEQGLIPPAPPGYVPMILPPGVQLEGHHPELTGHHMPPPGYHPNPQGMHQQGGYHPNAIPQGHHDPTYQQQLHHAQQAQMQGQQYPQGGHHPNAIPQGHHDQAYQQQLHQAQLQGQGYHHDPYQQNQGHHQNQIAGAHQNQQALPAGGQYQQQQHHEQAQLQGQQHHEQAQLQGQQQQHHQAAAAAPHQNAPAVGGAYQQHPNVQQPIHHEQQVPQQNHNPAPPPTHEVAGQHGQVAPPQQQPSQIPAAAPAVNFPSHPPPPAPPVGAH